MNSTVLLSLLSAVFFTASIAVLVARKRNADLGASVSIPLFSSLFLYAFIVVSNFPENSGLTGWFDPLEDIAEIVFMLVFLVFVNNWRKERSEARFRELFKLSPMPFGRNLPRRPHQRIQ